MASWHIVCMHLVVEVVDVHPFDALPLVLLLLLLQHQLDEQLLQLFVAVVDAELRGFGSNTFYFPPSIVYYHKTPK